MTEATSRKISIELFPAGNGDAILLDFGQELLLIDGGFTSTFRDHLKPRLMELHNAGRRLSKFVVTHIDADHISGAIAFIKENGPSETPAIIGIDEVWFNSYRHLHFKDKEAGVVEGELPDIKIVGGLESTEADDDDQLVSYRQGSGLGHHILKNGYPWNTTFKGLAVKADLPLKIPLGPEAVLTLLGPTQEALDRMANKWYKYLIKRFEGQINEDAYFDDAFELMMEEMRQAALADAEMADQESLVSARMDWVEENAVDWVVEDNSPTNGSSIIFLLEYNGKKMLFLGDAIPGQVIEQLKLLPETQFPMELEVLKVAHHGAWSNNSPELIKMLRAKNYLFSSNGRNHHHPHFETMAWILKSHDSGTKKNMVFNYNQGERLLDIDESWIKKKYNYEVLWPDADNGGNGSDGYVKIML